MTSLVWILILQGACQDPLDDRGDPAEARENGALKVFMANDIFTGSDDYFSNGWIVSWHSRTDRRWEGLLPHGLVWLTGFMPGAETSHKRVSLGLSQLIFTPRNIASSEPQPGDTPYSGALLGALSFSAQDERDMWAWQLLVGAVGPSSLAEETQEWAHATFDSARPEGWRHQLKDEFIVNLHGQRKRKLASFAWEDEWSADFGAVLGAALGNMTTQMDAALEVRAGWRMPPGFDDEPIGRKLITHGYLRDPVEYGFSIHAFGSAAVRGWARFIFLDGNTWKESSSVDRNTWTLVLGGGVSAAVHRIRLTLEFGATSRPVEGMSGFDAFGSLSLTHIF